MRKIKSLLMMTGLTLALAVVGSISVNGQETMMKKVGDTTKTVAKKTVSGSKAVYRGGRRVGHTVGDRTWTGTKWVATKSWKGGRWVARKTANGTKWVYYKAAGKRTTRRP